VPEPAYNFAVVDAHILRSARPDARFLAWVRRNYGIERVVSLSGPDPIHEEARRLGLEVSIYSWKVSALPPRAELLDVLAALRSAKRVLLHCASGADRTGYAIAALRLTRDGWPFARTEQEMRSFSHQPERWPAVHEQLKRFAADFSRSSLR
jgi:protein tyrosine/serine phosphatase